MRKKLLLSFGPVLLAAVLLVSLFFSPVKINTTDEQLIHSASSSMSGNVLRGNSITKSALATDQYVPFFGSSELSRISPFHPSVLAQKYQRGYTPFLMGAPGTQSLTQFMMMQSLGQDLKNKKAVFIISPQWFVKDGIKRDYFDAYYSQEQTLHWLLQLKKATPSDQYLASRLMHYTIVGKDARVYRMLQGVSQGQLPTRKDRMMSHFKYNLLAREDELFSTIGMRSRQQMIDDSTKQLPASYNEHSLSTLADQLGEKETKGNDFAIQSHFFDHRIKPRLDQLKGSQSDWDYRYSPEFADFQLVLDQLAKEHADCLFILPPVNGRWSRYTGLSPEMLQQFSSKITYQLRSQGFNTIADFTDQAQTPYFMQDTIHLGWQGWLAADQRIAPFLKDKKEHSKDYSINDSYFLSDEWQKENPLKLQQ